VSAVQQVCVNVVAVTKEAPHVRPHIDAAEKFSSFGGTVTVILLINSLSVRISPPSLAQSLVLCILLSHTHMSTSHLCPFEMREMFIYVY